MVIDTGRATTGRRKFKAPYLKNYKNEGPSKNHLKTSEQKDKTLLLFFAED